MPGGVIYLPRVPAGTLQPVSLTEDTVIGFAPEVLAQNPELAGVRLVVPANSLFANDGRRGGRMGISIVDPTRLPEPLPDGLDYVLDITVQTDGAQNFDRPVPACFPNVPNRDGVVLHDNGGEPPRLLQPGTVSRLQTAGRRMYVTGRFTHAGGRPSPPLAVWESAP